MNPDSLKHGPSRREFLQRSAVAGAALAGGLSIARSAHAAGSAAIRIALVGCGGRGTGAAAMALKNAAKADVRLVAMGDAFGDRIELSLRSLLQREEVKGRIDVPPERQFVGLDCCEKALASGVDMVLLCGPPGFRPAQFESAVKAGKHVFMEKPVATDAPGVRRILAANAEAKKKGLMVAVGHHLRHEDKHRELIGRIHDGAIGKLAFLRVYFNTGNLWVRPRKPDQTEFQYQVRNWYYFTWLSGDHIVEQHVHDLDVGNWIAQAHPVEANGMGGRQARIGKDVGEIFDHHAVEFTYAGGLKMFSFCRQIPGCWDSFAEYANGVKGRAEMEGHGKTALYPDGQEPLRWRRTADGHQVEMDDFFAAMAAGKSYNEADEGAVATMTAILGRMATYSGKLVTWDEALASTLSLAPKTFAWDAEAPVNPGPDGLYPCAIPGTSNAW